MIATIIILSTKKQFFFYVPNPKTDLQKKQITQRLRFLEYLRDNLGSAT